MRINKTGLTVAVVALFYVLNLGDSSVQDITREDNTRLPRPAPTVNDAESLKDLEGLVEIEATEDGTIEDDGVNESHKPIGYFRRKRITLTEPTNVAQVLEYALECGSMGVFAPFDDPERCFLSGGNTIEIFEGNSCEINFRRSYNKEEHRVTYNLSIKHDRFDETYLSYVNIEQTISDEGKPQDIILNEVDVNGKPIFLDFKYWEKCLQKGYFVYEDYIMTLDLKLGVYVSNDVKVGIGDVAEMAFDLFDTVVISPVDEAGEYLEQNKDRREDFFRNAEYQF